MKGFALLLLMISGLLSTVISLFKRIVMRNFGELNPTSMLSIGMWLDFFTNPWIILVFLSHILTFMMNMAVFSLEDPGKIIMAGSVMSPVWVLLTIYLSNRFLGEVITPVQIKGIIIFLLSRYLMKK